MTKSKIKLRHDDNGRECTRCLVYQSWESFPFSSSRKNNRSPECKKCRVIDSRERRKRHREANPPAKPRVKYWDRTISKREFLWEHDPLKLKAINTRDLFRKNGGDLEIPSVTSIEDWFKSLPDNAWVCYYSGEPLSIRDFSVDHKIPVSRGGTHDFTNIALCTKNMNYAKGPLNDTEFKDILNTISNWDEDSRSKFLMRLANSMKWFRATKRK